MVFQYAPVTKYIGKVVKGEEMTVGDFEALTGVALSAKLDPERVVFCLGIFDIANQKTRYHFFTPETSAVSRWMRLLTSLSNVGVTISGGKDLLDRIFWWEEKRKDMGKYGERNVLEVAGVPTPAELQAVQAVAAKATPSSTPAAQAAPTAGEWAETMKGIIRVYADGSKNRAELEKQVLADYQTDVQGREAEFRRLLNSMILANELVVKDGKLNFPAA